jgi:hypothetical protein
VEMASGNGSFPGAGFLRSKASGLLLILADNYNLTTNDPTTAGTERTEDAQRLFGKSSGQSQAGPVLAGLRASRAEITGSREGAKPRSSAERRAILATPYLFLP